ncbi:hypothetical protein [Kribbella sp. NPDC051770]|uniref:hypothetical protein n=1 Tax=Kribbella sp. NPDC051770 TaxID=3155413 RepID=UPI0034284A83
MSTATLPNNVTSSRRFQRVLRAIVVGMSQMLGGYWVVMIVGFLLVGIVIQMFSNGNDHSIWDYGTQSPKYFSLAIGITVGPAFFTLMISLGITRRMFSLAASTFLVGAAASTALLWVLVYQVEHVIYASQGWTQALANPHLFTKTSQAGLIFTEFFLLVLSHEVAGWLVGISFLRFGAWKGLLMLPVTLLPAAAAEFLLVAQWLAEAIATTGYHRPPLALAVPGVLVVSALGLYFGYLMIRPLGVRPTKG